MKNYGKKYKKSLELLGDKASSLFSFREGIDKVKQLSYARFNESINVSVVLGIDSEKSDQNIRGSLSLPNSFKEKIRVIVFAKGEEAEAAEKAGADFVGAEDLVEKILGGWLDFDAAVSTPDLMGMVGKTAKILGPKGLLPNKKNGTVSLNVSLVVKELKQGLVFFKNNKDGQVNFTFGKKSLEINNLFENLVSFLKALKSSRPSTAKGDFVKRIFISGTMGPGVRLDLREYHEL